MTGKLQNVAWTLLALLGIDVFMVMMTMTAIAAGDQVQHIPFWDAQIRFAVSLLA